MSGADSQCKISDDHTKSFEKQRRDGTISAGPLYRKRQIGLPVGGFLFDIPEGAYDIYSGTFGKNDLLNDIRSFQQSH